MRGDDAAFELSSEEGTTQGCPLAMAMYALSLSPLLKTLNGLCRQVWYADDATGCDKLERLRLWYDTLLANGPKYGYFPNPSKCILLVKPDRLERANQIFKGTGVVIENEGSKDSVI